MRKIFFKYSIGILLLGVATFSACKKDSNNTTDTSVVNDYFTAENESNKIEDAINSAAFDSKAMRVEGNQQTTFSLLPGCVTLLIDTTSAIRTIIILFDSTGCVCTGWDNKTRKGNIIATWTGRYRDPGTIITITTRNYYVNDVRFDYTKTVTNKGKNGAGNLTFDVNVSQALVTFTDGKTISWTSQRTREWISGSNTLTPLDDEYSITGSAQGKDRAGVAFSASITSPLIISVGCPWIERGTLTITPDGDAVRTVDFGDGSCDSQATATINGVVYNIAL